jgi:hypothetical protein
MGCWAILTVGTRSRGRQGYVEQAGVFVGSKVERHALKRTRGSSGRDEAFRVVGSASLPGRPGEVGLALRSQRLGKAFANKRCGEGGFSLVETSITLFLLMTIATFGLQTMMSGWMLQNSAVVQSMTDARAAIETAYAQRWVFTAITSSDVEAIPDPDLSKTAPYTLWPIYPASTSVVAPIGQTPSKPSPVTATVVRTCRPSTDPVTGAQSYLLESYVIYKDGLRQYCKVSKVYRNQ